MPVLVTSIQSTAPRPMRSRALGAAWSSPRRTPTLLPPALLAVRGRPSRSPLRCQRRSCLVRLRLPPMLLAAATLVARGPSLSRARRPLLLWHEVEEPVTTRMFQALLALCMRVRLMAHLGSWRPMGSQWNLPLDVGSLLRRTRPPRQNVHVLLSAQSLPKLTMLLHHPECARSSGGGNRIRTMSVFRSLHPS